MDRSVDSIGSCSLDVDADSSDISDTSGSLNFPTPISVKDITREFTANIRERCSIRTVQNSTAMMDQSTGQVRMVVTQPLSGVTESSALSPIDGADGSAEKKPSYLNLACCVNGYSNLTTYDSKIRQDINKSREVSPIRPSSSSIQYCKNKNSLAPPILHTMPNNANSARTKTPQKYESNNNHTSNGDGYPIQDNDMTTDERRNVSFIQQRVERLYGPGALTHNFYTPKKTRAVLKQRDKMYEGNGQAPTELEMQFQKLSPSKDYSGFRKKMNAESSTARHDIPSEVQSTENNGVDLPVLRHLSQEFRAQLPMISPKKNFIRQSPVKETITKVVTTSHHPYDEVDHKSVVHDVELSKSKEANPMVDREVKQNTQVTPKPIKDGNFFLALLKSEQARITTLAAVAEKYIDMISSSEGIVQEDALEDVLGLLRAASGKARLLVTQKMKQFEGLCHKNLNKSPEDKFPTTVDDLQGFWDMVNLQVDHIDTIFNEINELKENNWKKPVNTSSSISPNKPNKNVKTGNVKANMKSMNASQNGKGPIAKNTAALSAAAAKREAQRQQMIEMKRKHKLAMATTNGDSIESSCNIKPVEFFVNKSND